MNLIHSTAIIDPQAELGSNVEIGPWCVIGPEVRIGQGTKLLSHVSIQGNTSIGEENVFFPFCSIGHIPQDLKYKGEKTFLKIGDFNTFRENVTIHLGTQSGAGLTYIGSHNLLMAYTHLGHDCHIGNHCILSNSAGLAGHVTIEDYVTLGGMVGIAQFVKVGKHAYIAAQSGLEKDVPPYVVAVGSRPCSIKGINIVGLKRRSLALETIQILNEAIKFWMRPQLPKEQCLLEMEACCGHIPEVHEMSSFIRLSKGVIR